MELCVPSSLLQRTKPCFRPICSIRISFPAKRIRLLRLQTGETTNFSHKMAMQYIGVFLSSHDNVPSAFQQATEEVGKWIGQSGRSLVYGGSGVGMMEVLAQSAKQAGARIFGIVPQFVVDRNVVSDTLDVDIRTAGLADRKTILIERSDLMIALPGGVGTLDEIFTLMAEITIGGTRKHLVLYNVEGCWNKLVELLDEMVATNLVHQTVRNKIHVVETTEALEELCQSL